MMKQLRVIFLIFSLLILTLLIPGLKAGSADHFSTPSYPHQSNRTSIADAVIISDSDPYFGLIGTSLACWYDTETNSTGLLPLLVQHDGGLTIAQDRFLAAFSNSTDIHLLVLGEHLQTSYESTEYLGPAPAVSVALATSMFTAAPSVLILPYGYGAAYQLSLLATPLASYLNMPVLIYNENVAEIQSVCSQLQTTQAYVVGNISIHLEGVTVTSLPTETAITEMILTVITDDFGSINYLTMTNPSDVVPPAALNVSNLSFSDHLINKKIIILGKEIDLVGNDTRTYTIPVPDGLTRIQISGEISQQPSLFQRYFPSVVPLLFLTLTDAQGRIVSYANSIGYDIGNTYAETLSCNASGPYSLQIKAYHGIKGGFFVQRGLSLLDANITISVRLSTLDSPHVPLIPKLSSLAPYLTAAHGGLLIANASWELTDASYVSAADGSGAGPWYTESLHPFTNAKVNLTVQQLRSTIETLDSYDLLEGYLGGPAWLAILADTTMIPMYYYGPSQEDIPDRGLPSDNPYSLNQSLSVGRLIGWDVSDVSTLIARTFFYQDLCGEPENSEGWHGRFHFLFGEGYSETGGFFHQVPYAWEIRQYGFDSKVYGDCRNSRQIAELLDIFPSANYLEYLGHGDWFWFPASLYGLDMYSKAFDVAHVKDWVFDKPSLFLSAACLMGRTDGLPPQMNIGLALLHAGCNGFIGATRETGQESGLTTLENHLIVDDWSVGEALRGEKRVDTELPTFYVRVLYGDPAFNPYEPLNGFHSQGRPVLVGT